MHHFLSGSPISVLGSDHQLVSELGFRISRLSLLDPLANPLLALFVLVVVGGIDSITEQTVVSALSIRSRVSLGHSTYPPAS